MDVLLLVGLSGLALLVAYLTYGRWLSRRIFRLDDTHTTPAHTERDDCDYCPTRRSIVFGHHFTSIAGTGPIVGPAIAVMWGWLPAILWVVFGAIFVGAVHDFGALVVSMRAKGRSIGDIAGDLLGPRARLIFLAILIVGLWIVLAIFGLVIAAVLRQYPQAVTPVLIQIPLAIGIGLFAHRAGRNIFLPSLIALAAMYATVIFGDVGLLHDFNQWAAGQSNATWVVFLLIYAWIASVIPVWVLLQPRDYINALQLLTGLAILLAGIVIAALSGGDPAGDATRPEATLVAPVVNWNPEGAPPLIPVLFITIACGACSGFHCLVGSGTTSKQIDQESHARSIGYGSMLTEGFLATLVIAACAAGIGLGVSNQAGLSYRPGFPAPTGFGSPVFKEAVIQPLGEESPRVVCTQAIHPARVDRYLVIENAGIEQLTHMSVPESAEHFSRWVRIDEGQVRAQVNGQEVHFQLRGQMAFGQQYQSWSSAKGLASTVGAFVNGSANFIAALGIPIAWATALMAVMVASFAATTMDTACRLQRYVIQELASTFLPRRRKGACPTCNYDLSAHTEPASAAIQPCPECGSEHPAHEIYHHDRDASWAAASPLNPFKWLATIHGATLFAVVTAFFLAMLPQTWNPFADAASVGVIDSAAAWLKDTWNGGGAGALILWPLFGATNQLLAGFAFIVIGAWLARRGSPRWFITIPTILMLLIPAAAMIWQAFIGNADNPSWLTDRRWLLVAVAAATLALELWLLVEVGMGKRGIRSEESGIRGR